MNEKHKAFCEQFVVDLNGTQAAIRAGYAESRAEVTACELLKRDDVKAYISQLRERLSRKTGLTAEAVLNELKKIVFNDPREFFDENGNVKDMKELSDDAAGALASIEVFEEFGGRGEQRTFIGYTKKIKFWDKVAAIEKAMKHLGMFEKDNTQARTAINIPALESMTIDDIRSLIKSGQSAA